MLFSDLYHVIIHKPCKVNALYYAGFCKRKLLIQFSLKLIKKILFTGKAGNAGIHMPPCTKGIMIMKSCFALPFVPPEKEVRA